MKGEKVIAKLCTTRGKQDIVDIDSESVIKDIDWERLESLANLLRNNKISGIDNIDYNYKEYKDKHRS